MTEMVDAHLHLEAVRAQAQVRNERDAGVVYQQVDCRESLGDGRREGADRCKIGQIERLDVRAPVSGIVHQLQVTTPRAVIRPADPIMFLIPQDRPLVIAGITAAVALLWIAGMRLLPEPAAVRVRR